MNRVRKILRSAAMAALTLALATGISSAAFGTGTVTASSLYLRKEPSTKSATLGGAWRGAVVEVLEDAQDGWYKVNLNGKVGYMSAQYLNVTPSPVEETAAVRSAPLPEQPDDAGEAAEPVEAAAEAASAEEPDQAPAAEEPAQTEAAPAEEDVQQCGMVTASSLNVRSGPSLEASRIGSLRRGTVVTVEEQLEGWCRITAGSVKGYVASEYLSLGTRTDLQSTAAAAGAQIIDLAMQYLGTPYVYGGTTPAGFDCSGFVYYIYKTAGYSAPRTGNAMWANYEHVEFENLLPGDVVCFTKTTNSNVYITHVGMYVGDGKFIHSSSPSSGGVILSSLSEHYYATRYVGAVRII